MAQSFHSFWLECPLCEQAAIIPVKLWVQRRLYRPLLRQRYGGAIAYSFSQFTLQQWLEYVTGHPVLHLGLHLHFSSQFGSCLILGESQTGFKIHWHLNATWPRITIGYHRLYSHRAFRAGLAVRMILAALGSAGFQGSIKVSRLSSHSDVSGVILIRTFKVVVRNLRKWQIRYLNLAIVIYRCLRHRLHHVR